MKNLGKTPRNSTRPLENWFDKILVWNVALLSLNPFSNVFFSSSVCAYKLSFCSLKQRGFASPGRKLFFQGTKLFKPPPETFSTCLANPSILTPSSRLHRYRSLGWLKWLEWKLCTGKLILRRLSSYNSCSSSSKINCDYAFFNELFMFIFSL